MDNTLLRAKDWEQAVKVCETNIKDATLTRRMFMVQLDYARSQLKKAESEELELNKDDNIDTGGIP